MQMVLKNSEAFPFVYLQLIDVVGNKLFSRCFKLAIFKGQMIQQFMYEFESIYTTAQRTILDSKTLLDASNGYSL
ncbi:hypothetical protein FB379_12949 [Aeribacillus composti]|uniref:Uncharacterized protein n=2 Tax=Aeribacillus pallidus TaxID=33936 RepID=A0A223E681_9BACI|nr:hypothetical protein AP3564_11150 [Aeribacillus pallidus]TVZ77975.1 hypothetical protein FB379_12949 [Aeribacillus composti]